TRLRTRSPRSRTACTPRTGQHPRSYPPILRTSRARQAPSLEYSTLMNLGYDGKLYVLAFDHRGSFQKRFFGIAGEPDGEQTAIIADAKHLIYEGVLQAVGAGADPAAAGVLVDEQFGSTVPAEAHERGLKLAMPAERSGQNMFDFEYGEQFGEHI